MDDVYKRLARRLDELPNGFPSTKSGVELKILQKIFTPDEAEMTLKIRPIPETVEAIAERLGKPVPEMQAILDNLVVKGQIGSLKIAGQRMYLLLPFVIGIFELQVNRMDEELARLFDEYEPEFVKAVGRFDPPVARVVPVNQQIDAELHVHRYEDVRRMVDEAKSFELNECICRKERALLGEGCGHMLEACLSFSNEEGEYDRYARGKTISKEEALKVIADAEAEGLVHCTYNVQHGQIFLCNCCGCCCGLLRSIKKFKVPSMLAKSNFVASIDQQTCIACGVCANERCPMEAIVEEDGVYRVLVERCIGCGVCTSTCPTESITLVRKPEGESGKPPANLVDWYFKRAASRGIDIKMDAD
jgi:Pyruvate/2-oxoacid:ferredoxin oxidoreductase delta subunit